MVDRSELVSLDGAGLMALHDATTQLTRAGATGVTLTRPTRPVLLLPTFDPAAGRVDPGISCARLSARPALLAQAGDSGPGW